MRSFIDQQRFGVEPIGKRLRVASSAYWRLAARQRNPSLHGARARRDKCLIPPIQRVWLANLQVYGADKVWRQLQREGVEVARCTVERLMRRLGPAASCAARLCEPPLAIPRRRVRWIGSIGGSRRIGRISSGYRISPISRPGGVLSMSPLSSTSLPATLSVGGRSFDAH